MPVNHSLGRFRILHLSGRNISKSRQGIAKLYERREQWEQYTGSLLKLAEIFSDSYVFYSRFSICLTRRSGEALKCAENISKYIQVKRQYGSRRDVRNFP